MLPRLVVVVLAVLLVVGTQLAPRGAVEARAAKGKKVKTSGDARREVGAVLGAALPDLDFETRLAQARAADPLTITGSAQLSGTVFASELVIAEGSDVVIRPGTVFVVGNDVRIEADPTFETEEVGKAATLPQAAPGVSRPAVVFEVGRNMTVRGALLGEEGGDGADFTDGGTAGAGGDGGAGMSFVFHVGGFLEVQGIVMPGRGGDGGEARIDLTESPTGAAVETRGGAGGPAGDVLICAGLVVADGERFFLRRGGRGGDAVARAADGTPGDAFNCETESGAGGDAVARGGDAGRATRLLIETGGGIVAGVFDATPVELRSLVRIFELDTVALPDPDDEFETLDERAMASFGGSAFATGGNGGALFECIVDLGETCPKRGGRPANGANGGDATATGGRGGTTPVAVRTSANGLDDKTDFFTVFGAPGGGAFATGGRGGNGAGAGPAQKPRPGGRGGRGGRAKALGGDAGSSLFVSVKGNSHEVIGPGNIPDAVVRASAGAAEALGGDGGPGGDGGDCCGNPGKLGGKGGKGGKQGKARVARLGAVPIGKQTTRSGLAVDGSPGADGSRGASCDVGGEGSGSGTAGDPFIPPAASGRCNDVFPTGDPVVGFDFFLPGTTEGLLQPPSGRLLVLGQTLFYGGDDPAIRVETRINGFTVFDAVVPRSGRFGIIDEIAVQFAGPGRACVEHFLDGELDSRLEFTIR